MPSATPSRHPMAIPRSARKELLKSNIQSMMEKASLDRIEERRSIEEDLKRITSLEILDPEEDRKERERRNKARDTLLEVEEDLDEEFKRLMSSL